MSPGSIMDWRQEVAGGYARTWHDYRAFVALCVRWGEPGRWIDLGAGLGYFTECCHRFGIPCRGYEGSEYAIAAAHQREPALDLRRHDLLDPLPEPDGAATVVFCNQVIEHLPPASMAGVLREARRVLAPGGLFFVASPGRHNPAGRTPGHVNLLAPSELRRALVDAGFGEVWSADYPRPLPLPGRAGRLVAGALFFLAPLDRWSATATALAFAPAGAATPPRVHGARSFHLRRLLGW